MEENKRNVFARLQKARADIKKKEIKMTGQAKRGSSKTGKEFGGYKYFQLSDILPHITEASYENGICCLFQCGKEEASLEVVNVDNAEDRYMFTMEVERASIMSCGVMQNIGGTRSFAERYLYMTAFEISENDLLDELGADKEAEEKKEIEKGLAAKISAPKVKVLENLINETESDMEKFLEYFGVTRVVDLKNEQFTTAMKILTDKKNKMSNTRCEELEDF